MTENAYPDALPPQYRLHWYVLERVLGQGGFGITYLAQDTNLDQPVAIKEYLPIDVATRRPDATVRARTDDQNERYRWGLERFLGEARTLARFDHPNIVRVHSVFEFNGTAYMVMRFEEGENFAALLERRRTLPEAELARVLLPILDGLELVHGAGFIHRDVKPDNIHIRADGSPVLLDFGSARLALGRARTVTILVAPGYAPFEQYYTSGESQGPWTDIYGLAATCYRAIAGVAPMDAIARSKGILGSTHEILIPAATIGAGRYSAQLLKAIDHALEFAEKDRPQTIAAWRKELLADSREAHLASGTKLAQAVSASAQGDASQRWRPSRVPIVWATMGALVAAFAVVLWLNPGSEQKRLADALERVEAERKRAEEERIREARQKAELDAKRAEEASRRDAEAAKRADAERARQEQERQRAEAEARQKAELAAKRAEEQRRRQAAVQSNRTATKAAVPASTASETSSRIVAAPQEPTPLPPGATVATFPSVPAPAPGEASKTDERTGERSTARELLESADRAFARADYAEAVRLYRRSASVGGSDAQMRLGDLYASGRGVQQNFNQAYMWYGLALRAGNSEAKTKQEEVAARLQPAEIRQADRLIERQARPAR